MAGRCVSKCRFTAEDERLTTRAAAFGVGGYLPVSLAFEKWLFYLYPTLFHKIMELIDSPRLLVCMRAVVYVCVSVCVCTWEGEGFIFPQVIPFRVCL